MWVSEMVSLVLTLNYQVITLSGYSLPTKSATILNYDLK